MEKNDDAKESRTIAREKPKWNEFSDNRFFTMYLGLGIIAVAVLLMLIVVNTPSLKGDDGFIMFFSLLVLAGVGLVTALRGLIIALLD